MTFFILQLTLYLILGFSFVFFKKYTWGIFVVILGALFPYSPIFSAYFYYSGATVFDFYIIGLGLGSVFLSLFSTFRMTFSSKDIYILASVVLFVFLSCCISLLNGKFVLIAVLKDLKPMFLIVILFYTYRVVTLTTKAHEIKKFNVIGKFLFSRLFLLLLCIKSILFLYLNVNGYLYSNGKDDFYVADPEMISRYADFSIIFIFVMVLFSLGTRRISSLGTFYYAFCGIVLSGVAGNRTFFVMFLFLSFFSLYKSHKILFYFLSISFFSVISFQLSILEINAGGRFLSLLSFDNLVKLLSVRYSPLFALYEGDVTYFDYLFGFGLGTTFYIPWFSYRDGVDPFSPFIDNFYLTIFAKFGVIGMVLIMLFLLRIASVVLKGFRLNVLFFIVFLMYTTTMSFWYQSSFSYLAICWFTLFFTFVNAKILTRKGCLNYA
jgi:hypothetical protein